MAKEFSISQQDGKASSLQVAAEVEEGVTDAAAEEPQLLEAPQTGMT